MEAGFFKWSSASFCSFRFFVFLLKKMSLLKSKRVRYLLMKNSTFAQINTQVL